jgi:acyl-CoA hydrolase/RimJ/RimL family protein N-acetyltransferase
MENTTLNQDVLSSMKDKICSPEDAVLLVESGNRVFVGTACATPRSLVNALEKTDKDLRDVQLYHFLVNGGIPFEGGIPKTKYHHKAFFVGTETRETIKIGKADYIPVSLGQIPHLLKRGGLNIDVALIQVSMPDEKGFVSLGVSTDITRAATQYAKTVIAELNPHMPRTLGDTFIPIDEIDKMVIVDTPVTEYVHPHVDDKISERIARYVARIIENGSTLQIGLGRIPNEMCKYLTNRRNLGIHSDVITDPIVELIEKGVINGEAKTIHARQIVASYCMGTRRLYDLIDDNPMFAFHPIEYVSDPSVIASNYRMVSVTQAWAVDLMGQVCSDQFEGELYSGVSTQPEFLRGSANSLGGKPIVCLCSTTEDGKTSRIRPLLHEGEGVTIPRSDVHYVITEYGYAYLFCKSIHERALALIEIAHPSFRQWLLDEAKRIGYVRSDQILKTKGAYPVEEVSEIVLKNKTEIVIRPARATDVKGLQDVFYHLTPHDVYTRFFSCLKSLSISMAEHLCNVDYDHEMAFVAVIGDEEEEQVIGSACYVANPSTNMADVAYMIRPEWKGLGLGILLQQTMIEYAKRKGLRGFTADILGENEAMLKLIRKSGTVTMKPSSGTFEVEVMF